MLNIKPQKLSIIIALIAIILGIVLFIPISQVFSGNWILQQNIDFLEIEAIRTPEIEALNISSLEVPIGIASIRFYAIFVTVGVLLGYLLTIYLAKFNLVVSTVIDRLFIGLMFIGFIGARFFYVAFNWSQFYNPDSIQNTILDIFIGVNQGGLALFGGLIAGGLYLWYYTNRFHFNLFEFLDFITPGLLLGQIIGRFGNFFNYEAYGEPTKVLWKMYVPPTARATNSLEIDFYHPTFLYEIIPNLILLIVILFNYEKLTQKNSGLVLGIYALGYGLIRFFTELFRNDALVINIPDIKFGIFTYEAILVSQIAALSLLIFGIYTILTRRKILYLKKQMTEIKY